MGGINTKAQDQLTSALEAALESTQDFTDSAYTSHEHREQILLLAETLRSQLSALLQAGMARVQCVVLFCFAFTP